MQRQAEASAALANRAVADIKTTTSARIPRRVGAQNLDRRSMQPPAPGITVGETSSYRFRRKAGGGRSPRSSLQRRPDLDGGSPLRRLPRTIAAIVDLNAADLIRTGVLIEEFYRGFLEGGGPGPDSRGVREPRRPNPNLGAGGAALPRPASPDPNPPKLPDFR